MDSHSSMQRNIRKLVRLNQTVSDAPNDSANLDLLRLVFLWLLNELRSDRIRSHSHTSYLNLRLFADTGNKWQQDSASIIGGHSSFIDGRVGTAVVDETDIGIVGEVHPKVLEAWRLENPVAAFELNMKTIFEIKQTHRT